MANLTIAITGCRSDDGHVYAALYAGPEGFPDDSNAAIFTGKAAVQNGRATFEIPDLAPGMYAAGGFHDENDDGEMNMRLKIFPKEGFCLSGEGPGMKKPVFEDAAFKLEGDMTIDLEMQYLL